MSALIETPSQVSRSAPAAAIFAGFAQPFPACPSADRRGGLSESPGQGWGPHHIGLSKWGLIFVQIDVSNATGIQLLTSDAGLKGRISPSLAMGDLAT
jgi:hypothetical protein